MNVTFLITAIVIVIGIFTLSCSNDKPSTEDRGVTKPDSPDLRINYSKRLALVIGNKDYSVGRLRNTINDSKDMASTLRDLGFEVIEGTNLSREETIRKIREFRKKLKQGVGIGLFYYSGHGIQVNGQNYLIPVGADMEIENDAELEAVPIQIVLVAMESARTELNVVLLDACRDNPFTRGFKSGGQTGLATMRAPQGTIIAYATAPGSVARDRNMDESSRNGLYTGVLLKKMKTPGLDIKDMLNEVGLEVSAISEEAQIPWVNSSPTKEFYLVQEVLTEDAASAPTTITAPTKDLEEKQKELEAERMALEAERQLLEEEKKLVEEKRKLAEERQKLEQEKETINTKREEVASLPPTTNVTSPVVSTPSKLTESSEEALVDTSEHEVASLPQNENTGPIIDEGLALPSITEQQHQQEFETDFGNYYALLIGNNDYLNSNWQDLKTPLNDISMIEKVLKQKYGFKTKVLRNAKRTDILAALEKYQKELSSKDNLLIYYAGHGQLDEENNRGYWVPIDGEHDRPVNWISTLIIADFLSTMEARHILVVADSCYSGTLTRSSLPPSKLSKDALKSMLNKKSRTALTSGDVQPVLDAGGGKYSVFAKAFIDALQANNEILTGQNLYGKVYSAVTLKVEQVPQYYPIRFAGHQSGDMLFVPVN